MSPPRRTDAAATLATVVGLQAWLRHAEAHPENPYFARRVDAMKRALDAKSIDDVSERGLLVEAVRAYGAALAELRRHHKYLGMVPAADAVADAVVVEDRFVSGKLAPSADAIRYAGDLATRLPTKEPTGGKVIAIDARQQREAVVHALALAIEAASRIGRRAKGAPLVDAKAALGEALRALGLPAGSDDAIKKARRRATK